MADDSSSKRGFGLPSTIPAGSSSTYGSMAASSTTINPGSTLEKSSPSRLRQLPGYLPPSISSDFLASHLDKPANAAPGFAGAMRPAVQTPAASRPYHSRERLYYQTGQTATPSSAPSLVNSKVESAQTDAEIKAEAPPTNSLYDDPMSPEHRIGTSSDHQEFPNPSAISRLASLASESGRSRIPTDLLMDQSGSSSDPIDCWVTVFGFGGSQASAVIDYFRTIGNIVHTELGQRNWLHIQFDSPWTAQKALLKNGSVLAAAGSAMIGVLPTKRAMDQVGLASTSFMSPLKKGEAIGPISPFSSTGPITTTTTIPQTPGFPQTSIYASTHIPSQTKQQTSNVPSSIFAAEASKENGSTAQITATDSEGPATRFFNYIFGF